MSKEYEAGHELDVLIAEKVMGCQLQRYGDFHLYASAAYKEMLTCGCRDRQHRDHTQGGQDDDCLAPYSTSIAAVWEVVANICNRDQSRYFFHLMLCSDGKEWAANFRRDCKDINAAGRGDSAPLAICRAAMKAVESP